MLAIVEGDEAVQAAEPSPTASEPSSDAEATAQVGIEVLKVELSLVNANVDSLDRKAALIPPLLFAAAAFLLGPPGVVYSPLQVGLIVAALVVGMWASWEAYRALAPDEVRLGPDADMLVKYLDAPLYPFQQRVAEALAEAVRETSTVTLAKGERLSRSMKLVGGTLLLLVVIRASGGIGL